MRLEFVLGFCLLAAVAACEGCSRVALRPAATARRAPSRARVDRADIALGRRVDQKLVASKVIDGDARVTRYVSSIGRRLAARSARPELPWTFRVLDASNVNAYAVPGGFIYVTRGMLAWLDSEAELAAMLAHEIGHVVARDTERSSAWSEAHPGWLASAADTTSYELSRDEERDADAMAVRLLERSGYDPRAVAAMLVRLRSAQLAQSPKPSSAHDDWRTDDHPPTAARIARAALLAAGRPKGAWRRRSYLFHIDGLTFGSDSRNGQLLGRRYTCPDGGFVFEVPRGWHGQAGDGWLVAKGGKAMLVFAPARGGAPRSLTNTCGLFQPVSIAGFSGLLCTRRLGGMAMQVVLLHAARRSYFFLVIGLASDHPALRILTRGLRRWAGPLRIAVERVTRPTTLGAFARAHVAAVSVSELARLNGLRANERLRPGTLVKNVVAW